MKTMRSVLYFGKLLLGVQLLLFTACAEKDKCGGPGGAEIEQARMYCYLIETLPNLTNTRYVFMQTGNYLAYPDVYTDVFPLPADREKINFFVLQNDAVIDTLTIQYKVDTAYYDGAPCNTLMIIPKATNVKCFSTEHSFKVKDFR